MSVHVNASCFIFGQVDSWFPIKQTAADQGLGATEQLALRYTHSCKGICGHRGAEGLVVVGEWGKNIG